MDCERFYVSFMLGAYLMFMTISIITALVTLVGVIKVKIIRDDSAETKEKHPIIKTVIYALIIISAIIISSIALYNTSNAMNEILIKKFGD